MRCWVPLPRKCQIRQYLLFTKRVNLRPWHTWGCTPEEHALPRTYVLTVTARHSTVPRVVNFPLTTLQPCDKPVFANASIRKRHNALKISRSRVKRETTHPVVLASVVTQHTLPMPAIRVTGSPGIERVLAKLKLKIASRQKRRKKPMGSESTMWNDGNNAERKSSTSE